MTINETKLQEFVGKMLQDLGAAVNSPLVLIGDRLSWSCRFRQTRGFSRFHRAYETPFNLILEARI